MTTALHYLPNVLNAEQIARCQGRLAGADWRDGRITAGPQSAAVKANQQLAEDDPVARELGDIVLRALERNPAFISAALPARVFPPLFNRYAAGMAFGAHVDNAIRQAPGTPLRIRTDLSATLFLSAPEDYEGGELIIEENHGAHRVKLAAGDMVLYPAGHLHSVAPVTAGVRLASFFWIQSMIRDNADRALLFELDTAIRDLGQGADSRSVLKLTACYHTLLRRWAEL